MIERAFTAETAECLKDLLHHRPREYGRPTSVWTPALAAEVSFAEGLTAEQVSDETIREMLKRLKVAWQRAKQWITRPDPAYAQKKQRDRLMRLVQGHPEWALGFEDETWWGRFAQPPMHTWSEPGQTLKLQEKTPAPNDPEPKALACYGRVVRSYAQAGALPEQVWLRFADGNPNSQLTIDYLRWCGDKLGTEGKQALLLIWDNASWHLGQAVKRWITAHNQQVKHSRHGVGLLVCPLPTKSPWPISPTELAERVCAAFGEPYEPH